MKNYILKVALVITMIGMVSGVMGQSYTLAPANDSEGVLTSPVLSIVFEEGTVIGFGANKLIYLADIGWDEFYSFNTGKSAPPPPAVTRASELYIVDNVLYIDLSNIELSELKFFSVFADEGAILINGSPWNILSNFESAQWSFTTRSAPTPFSWVDPQPTVSNITSSSLSLNVRFDGAGDFYYVVTTSGTSPSASQVKDGKDHLGSNALLSGSGTMLVNTLNSLSISTVLLEPATYYRIHVVGQDGNATFSDVRNISFSKPLQYSLSPANNEVGVNINNDITITFNGQIYNSASEAITSSNVASVITFKIGSSVGSDVGFTATYNIESHTVTITPSNKPLVEDIAYYYALNVQDALQVTYALSATFVTADLTPPELISFSPDWNDTGTFLSLFPKIELVFDEELFFVPALPGGSSIPVTTNPNALMHSITYGLGVAWNGNFSITYNNETNNVVITFIDALLPNTTYTFNLVEYEDEFGNAIQTPLSFSYNTDVYNVWNGAVDTDWTNGGNWQGGYTPGKSVSIPKTSNVATINSISEIRHLIVEPGAVLNHTGGTLTVTGDMLLQSSIDYNATYIPNGNLVVNSNKVRVEQFISNPDLTFLVGSPTNASTLAGFGGRYSLSYYNNPTDAWVSIPNTQALSFGRGYRMWTDNNMVFFTGGINKDNIIVNLVSTEGQGYGWNLVGNPFTASIDWTALDVDLESDIEDSFWIWNPSLRGYGAYNDFSELFVNVGSSEIPSNHAFLVKVKSGIPTSSLELNKTSLVANSINYLKSSRESSSLKYIKIAGVNSKGVKDEIAIAFVSDVDVSPNYFTEKKFTTRKDLLQLYTDFNSNPACISSVNIENGIALVELGFTTSDFGDYSIEYVSGNTEGFKVLLHDNEMDKETDFTVGGQYPFSLKSGDIIKNTSRFSLEIIPLDYATSINKNEVKQDYSVFVKDEIVYVEVSDSLVGSDVEVVDALGRIVFMSRLNHNGVNRISELKFGTYIIVIKNQNLGIYEKQKVVVY